MKIFTSYFGNSRKLKEAGVNMICVAIGKPRFIAGIPQMLNVCPTRYMVSGPCSHDEYLKLYDRILASQDANQVVKQIEMLSGGKDVALCCYENRVISAIAIFWQNGSQKILVLKSQNLELLRRKSPIMNKRVCFENNANHQ